MSNGGVIARGRIKVDARKALDKLRDHMLVDPHLWACEIARVAVALGATRLDVDWDADDIVFDFDGRVLAPDQIAHARDHVLTPLDGADGDALRALGIGIGAALSLEPAYIDVLSAGYRVRFERRYVEDATAAPTPVAATTAPGVTRVHFKRKLGFGLFARLSEDPEEIPPSATTRRAGLYAPPPRLLIARREAPVLVVDLDVPGTTRAHLEVLRRPTEPRAHFFHYGVRIASSSVRGLWGMATRPEAKLPVRIVVDATDLPTNASRSQVRSDAELIKRAFERIEPAFAVAVRALRGEAIKQAATLGHTVTAHAEPAVLTDVLGAIAAEAAIALRANHPLEPEGRRLLEDEVAFDALGRRISLGSLRGGTQAHPLRVYDGTTALAEELAPWLSGTVWKRGLSAERAIEGLFQASVKELVEPALVAMQRRARALGHPASAPVTAATSADWKERFEVTKGPFTGLHGEVAFQSGPDRLATVRVFVDERLLETISVPGARLPVEIALAWPGRLVATFAYDAVERNEDLTRALHYALRVAAMGVGRHPTDPGLVRLASQAWADATRALVDGPIDPAALGPLATIPAWRTTDDRLVTFAHIYGYAKRTGAVCYAQTRKAAPDGRVVLDPRDVPPLRSLLDASTELVAYDRALTADPDASEPIPSLAVMVHRSGLEGFVAPSAEKRSRLRVYHAGICLRRETWSARNGPVDVVLVDPGAVPKPDGTGLRYSSPLPGLDAEEDALVEVVVQACESDAVDLSAVEDYLEVSRAIIADRKNDKALVKRIAALPRRREQRRLERLKEAVLARAPIDVDALTGGRLRGTTVAPKKGAVSVVLAPWGPATVLYRGHPLGTETIGRLDVQAFIDVVADELVEEWSALSEAGRSWAEEAIRDAAIDLVDKLSVMDGFTDNEVALRLTAFLVPESPMRLGRIVGQTPWPTVQGGTTAIGDAVQVNTGVHRYGPWRGSRDASPYDAPAIHLPITKIGEARRKVLAAAGVMLVDVTEPTTRLQALRAKTDGGAAPTLEGQPVHPLLRRSLAQLGATLIEGELELIDGGACDIGRVRPGGVRELLPVETGCPVRVIFRADTEDTSTAAREIIDATRQLLRDLVSHLETLPAFVRRRVRALVLAGVARTGKMQDEDRNLPLFEATSGRFYRLSFLQGYASYTTDPPPYPPVDDIVLVLEPSEATALSKVFQLRDDTQALRARARGLAARAAPPLTEIRVKEREQCMFFIDVNEEGITGEIGILKPSHVASRRIDVYTTMRPLTFMPDPEGWPIIAALNDDSLAVDDGFSMLLDPKKDTTRFHQLLRRILGASLARLLAAPADTLGVVRLPVPLLLRSVRSKRVAAAMGVFWLPKEWPERPSIHVEGIGIVDPDRVPLLEAGASSSRVVPVCGKLWVTAEAGDIARAVEDVMAWVSVRLPTHVRAHDNPPRYVWDLALLRVLEDPELDPIEELATDRPSPELMHVAARRAPHLIDRQTGDAPTAPTYVQHAEDLAGSGGAAEVAAAARPSLPASEGFLAGLVRRVTELVTGGPQVLEETPLTAALSEAIGALALTGQPVLYVQASKRGRPVTYDKDSRRLIVNARHPVVAGLAERRNGVLYLVLAALSEINRELVEVTDAEEVSKVLEMLRANEA
ncbi:MAG: hypothetical protein U0270_11900 [Labilithrix sp.]